MKVAISYTHDGVGRKIAQALVEALRGRGIEVVWDCDAPLVNPVSLPEWITQQMAENPVLTVLSPEYVRRFGNGDDDPHRKGGLFESRLLLRRIFDYTRSAGCPIIPVAVPGFSADLAPVVLKNLVI